MMKELTITVKDFAELFADDGKTKMVTLCEVENGRETGRKAVCKIVSMSKGIHTSEVRSVTTEETKNEAVDHPSYYGGADSTYEAIKVIDAWGLGFSLGNAVKYICRAGNKLGNSKLQDLRKALWYCQHEIEKTERGDDLNGR